MGDSLFQKCTETKAQISIAKAVNCHERAPADSWLQRERFHSDLGGTIEGDSPW